MTLPLPTIEELVAEGERLHAELSGIKTQQSKENADAHQVKIERFRTKIKTEQHNISRQVDELRGKKSLLTLLDDMLKTDHAEAKSHMFNLIQEKKDDTFGRSPSPL